MTAAGWIFIILLIIIAVQTAIKHYKGNKNVDYYCGFENSSVTSYGEGIFTEVFKAKHKYTFNLYHSSVSLTGGAFFLDESGKIIANSLPVQFVPNGTETIVVKHKVKFPVRGICSFSSTLSTDTPLGFGETGNQFIPHELNDKSGLFGQTVVYPPIYAPDQSVVNEKSLIKEALVLLNLRCSIRDDGEVPGNPAMLEMLISLCSNIELISGFGNDTGLVIVSGGTYFPDSGYISKADSDFTVSDKFTPNSPELFKFLASIDYNVRRQHIKNIFDSFSAQNTVVPDEIFLITGYIDDNLISFCDYIKTLYSGQKNIHIVIPYSGEYVQECGDPRIITVKTGGCKIL
ncbi:hypothetical protein SDC9_110559 [bioreactor metagenome]|uniref:Uncharacterized protein n=1 Tax=bioreactor metagenome TaxID=1076179 RepID=A0A645BF46_9ZZZZ|nr:hypothetical protein [Oscillospiraceae bacterium]